MSALCKVEMSSLPFRGVIREAEIGSDHDERMRTAAYRGAFRGRSEETDGAISGAGAGDQHLAWTSRHTGHCQTKSGRDYSQLALREFLDCDVHERHARYREGLKLWKALLDPLMPTTRRELSLASPRWPPPLKRRLPLLSVSPPADPGMSPTSRHQRCPAFEYKARQNLGFECSFRSPLCPFRDLSAARHLQFDS